MRWQTFWLGYSTVRVTQPSFTTWMTYSSRPSGSNIAAVARARVETTFTRNGAPLTQHKASTALTSTRLLYNNGIFPSLCSSQYASVDDAVDIIMRLTKSAELVKLDFSKSCALTSITRLVQHWPSWVSEWTQTCYNLVSWPTKSHAYRMYCQWKSKRSCTYERAWIISRWFVPCGYHFLPSPHFPTRPVFLAGKGFKAIPIHLSNMEAPADIAWWHCLLQH